MFCEKCWRDAGGNYEAYLRMLEERKDKPCSPEQQAAKEPTAVTNRTNTGFVLGPIEVSAAYSDRHGHAVQVHVNGRLVATVSTSPKGRAVEVEVEHGARVVRPKERVRERAGRP